MSTWKRPLCNDSRQQWMAVLGAAFGGVCGGYRLARGGGYYRDRLEPCNGHSDYGGVCVRLGHCAEPWPSSCAGGNRAAELGVPGAFGDRYRAFVAVLFSRAADGAGVECSAG